MDEPLAPGLYIVATPIGNLGDLTARAADTLRRADLVLAEDTRVSGKLLAHAGAKTPMRPYHDHSSEQDRAEILARLDTQAVALISDAGTPLVSDPGYKLVRAVREAGHDVFAVPGPCAAIAAITVSGLPSDRFLFLGFLPARAQARAAAIAEIAAVRATLVLYESGPRLADTLSALTEALGAREAAVARELTKLHEECVTGALGELAERYARAAPKGEIVIVVGPPAEPEEATDAEVDAALTLALSRLSASRAAAQVADQLNIPRKRAYARALELSAR